MLPALVAAVSAIVIAAFGLIHRGDKHEHELAAQELELRSKVDKDSEAYRSLSALLDLRSRHWLNRAGPELKAFAGNLRFFGIGSAMSVVGLTSFGFLPARFWPLSWIVLAGGAGFLVVALPALIAAEITDHREKKRGTGG